MSSPFLVSNLPWVYLKFVLRPTVKADNLVLLKAVFLSEIVDGSGPKLLKVQFYFNWQDILFYPDDEVYLLLVFRPPVID